MFNMKDLGDMTKLAGQAKAMQNDQEKKHMEQMELLRKISGTLDSILNELRKG